MSEQDASGGAQAPGAIPQSNALAEASPVSLGELMSRDPRGYSRQDRDVIVAALRADRARRAEAEAKAAESGRKRSGRAPQAVRMSEASPVKNAEEIGL